jgi:ketosteroid isomerase-like protein
MTASKAGDLAAVLDLMTDDVIFMTPGRPPFGKREFAVNGERMKDFTMEGHHDPQEIEILARLGKEFHAPSM